MQYPVHHEQCSADDQSAVCLLNRQCRPGERNGLGKLTVQAQIVRRVLQEVGMDGNFADEVCVIRDPTRGLIGIIVLSRSPFVKVLAGGIELAFLEVDQVPLMEAAEGNIDGSGAVRSRTGVGRIRRLSCELCRAYVEGVVGFWLTGGDGLPW